MKTRHASLVFILLGITGSAFSLCAGCRPEAKVTETQAESGEPTTEEAEADEALALAKKTEKGGAQLWADNCMRCHNYRQPLERSDREWDTIVHHMRVRANLPAEQARLILRFLKAANGR